MSEQAVRSYGVVMEQVQGGRVLRLVYAYNAQDAIQQKRFDGWGGSKPAEREWPIEVGPALAMRNKYPEL